MQTLKVELGERSYPIHIGEGLLDQPELLAPHIVGRQVAIVSNTTVAPLYLERLTQTLSGYNVLPIVLLMARRSRTGKPCRPFSMACSPPVTTAVPRSLRWVAE